MAGTPGPLMSPQPGGPELRGPGDGLGPYGMAGLNGADFPSSMGQVRLDDFTQLHIESKHHIT